MDIQTVLDMSDMNFDLKRELQSFVNLCDRLIALTEEENECLLADGAVIDKEISYQKMVLLEVFEERTSRVFERVKEEAQYNKALHALLIDRVQGFQQKLKINTDLHLHVMQSSPFYGGGGDSAVCH